MEDTLTLASSSSLKKEKKSGWHLVKAIAKREYYSALDSAIGPVTLFLFWMVCGWTLFSTYFYRGVVDLRTLFGADILSPAMFLTIMVPALTMRTLAEEKRTGTIELLSTLPGETSNVIVGKFLGVYRLLLLGIAGTLPLWLLVSLTGTLDQGQAISGYLGLCLYCGALCAIGVMASSLSRDQVVSLLISLGIILPLFFLFWLGRLFPGFFESIARELSLSGRLDNMSKGVIDSRDILYFISVIIISLSGATLFLNNHRD